MSRPTLSQIRERMLSDASSRISGGAKLLRRSILAIISTSVSGAAHSLYGYADGVAKSIFPDTAKGTDLRRRGTIDGVDIKEASPGSADVKFTGTNGSAIGLDSILENSDGIQYAPNSTGVISSGQFIVTVTALTGGTATTLETGQSLSLVSPITGVDSSAIVQSTNNVEGVDVEDDDLYSGRILKRRASPPRGGNKGDYESWALEVDGVTRAWCFPKRMGPGTVGLTFVRDKDPAGFIPTSDEVTAVQTYVGAFAPTEATLTVFAPVAQPVNFTISGLTPGTSDVQAAVIAEIQDLFLREATPEGTIVLSKINEAISTATGEEDHILVSPSTNPTAASGSILTVGTFTWT